MNYIAESVNNYSLYQLLFFFIVYAVGGWCLEVAYHVVTAGEFVNRGFLNGPVCPIYGFGMIIIIIFLMPIKENLLALYVGSVVLTSLLELVTGFILKAVFHERWWDYSSEPFNLKGYICLRFSLIWGIGCVIMIDIVHVMINELISLIPHMFGIIILAVLLGILTVDFVITIITILKLNRKLKKMNQLAAGIRQISDNLGEQIYDITTKGMEVSKEARSGINEQQDIMLEKSENLKQSIADIKQTMTQAFEQNVEDFQEMLQKRLSIFESMNQQNMNPVENADNAGLPDKSAEPFYRISPEAEKMMSKVPLEAKEKIQNKLLELKRMAANFKGLTDEHDIFQSRMLKAYPNVKHTVFTKEIETLKKNVDKEKNEKNRKHSEKEEEKKEK